MLSWEDSIIEQYSSERQHPAMTSRQHDEASFAVQALEAAYRGALSLSYFAELSELGEARHLQVESNQQSYTS
jgi:hypothetical protein